MTAARQVCLSLSPTGNVSPCVSRPLCGWVGPVNCEGGAPNRSAFNSDVRSPRTLFFLTWRLAMFEMVSAPSVISPECLRGSELPC